MIDRYILQYSIDDIDKNQEEADKLIERLKYTDSERRQILPDKIIFFYREIEEENLRKYSDK